MGGLFVGLGLELVFGCGFVRSLSWLNRIIGRRLVHVRLLVLLLLCSFMGFG